MKNFFQWTMFHQKKNLTYMFREAMPLAKLDMYCLLPEVKYFVKNNIHLFSLKDMMIHELSKD